MAGVLYLGKTDIRCGMDSQKCLGFDSRVLRLEFKGINENVDALCSTVQRRALGCAAATDGGLAGMANAS